MQQKVSSAGHPAVPRRLGWGDARPALLLKSRRSNWLPLFSLLRGLCSNPLLSVKFQTCVFGERRPALHGLPHGPRPLQPRHRPTSLTCSSCGSGLRGLRAPCRNTTRTISNSSRLRSTGRRPSALRSSARTSSRWWRRYASEVRTPTGAHISMLKTRMIMVEAPWLQEAQHKLSPAPGTAPASSVPRTVTHAHQYPHKLGPPRLQALRGTPSGSVGEEAEMGAAKTPWEF